MYKIYGIYDKLSEECIYVGQTKQELEKRFYQHKLDHSYKEKKKYLNENECEIRLLHTCQDWEVNKWEQYYIDDNFTLDDLTYRHNCFNRKRAQKLSKIDKFLMAKMMLKNEIIPKKGTFDFDDGEVDLFS